MKTGYRPIHQIVDEQVKRWSRPKGEKEKETRLPVITVSREPGSGGQVLAEKLAQHFGFDMFHQNIVHQMAESAKLSDRLLNSLDEKGLHIFEEWLTGFSEHFWPDKYLNQLLKVIGTIGRHGRAVIVGRGANFILPEEASFRIRVVSPFKVRMSNVSKEFGVSLQEAEKRIINTESQRRAFIRRYFHASIAEPSNYDLVINTEKITLENAVLTVACSVDQFRRERWG